MTNAAAIIPLVRSFMSPRFTTFEPGAVIRNTKRK
jgi:hypothetical protein